MSQQESECSDDIFTVHTRVREISDSESDGSDVHDFFGRNSPSAKGKNAKRKAGACQATPLDDTPESRSKGASTATAPGSVTLDWFSSISPKESRPLKSQRLSSDSTPDDAVSAALRRNQQILAQLKAPVAEAHSPSDEMLDSDVEIIDPDEYVAHSKAVPMILVCRTKENQQAEFTVAQGTPLGDLFARFNDTEIGKALASELGRPPNFYFDGSRLDAQQTPAECDMEDRDLVDVS
mmetsp:Transcript_35336/g.66616  ORF Transcript_35336/g.66616 Transcript_35336/m.66616 type:complete len:237 (+) Transcript_35336:302-1012(+)